MMLFRQELLVFHNTRYNKSRFQLLDGVSGNGVIKFLDTNSPFLIINTNFYIGGALSLQVKHNIFFIS